MRSRLIIFVICLFVLNGIGYAQSIKVTGQVIDEQNIEMPGVSVALKGASGVGTITDLDGNFTLMVTGTKPVLEISFIGYKKQDVAVTKGKPMRIVLHEDAQQLDEVVIVGFGSQKKENLTGAVKSVDTKVLSSRPITSVVDGLQGAVAGLNITNDMGGAPGQKMQFNIRGVGLEDIDKDGSGSAATPLVLIDGMEGDLSTINPNDVESISVLKDAAAASIYGSRAPYGVVLVTLKKGERGFSMSYSGNVRISQPINTPHTVDSYRYALAVNDAFSNSGGSSQINNLNLIQAYMNGTSLPDVENLNWGIKSQEPDKDGNLYWIGDQQCWANTDWYDVHLKKSTYSQEHNLSMSGGSDKFNYFISGRYLNQNGLFRYSDDKYETFSLNGNFTMKINKYITAYWTTRMVLDQNSKPSIMNDLFFHNLGRIYPLVPLTLPNGEFHSSSLINALQNGGDQIANGKSFSNQGKVVIEPIKDWKIYADFSSRIESPNDTRQFKKIYYTQPDGRVQAAGVMKDVAVKHEVKENGSFTVQPASGESYYEVGNGHVNYWNFSVRTDYEKKWNDHYLKVLVGTQSEYYSTSTSRVGCSVVVSDDHPWIVNDPTNLTSESKSEWATLGVFSRINYSYANRYLVEVDFRGDGASRFPSDKRWGFFPSFSAGWNMAEEPFFSNLRNWGWDMFKIRGSYGTLGNQNTNSNYPYFQKMYTQPMSDYVFGESAGVKLSAPAPFTTNISWETVQHINLGLDLAMFAGRLNFTGELYERKTKNLVGPALPVPAVYGANVPKTNNAELRTRGWELEVRWADRINKDLSYEISGTLSDFKSVITKYDSPDKKLSGYYSGKVLGDIWGLKVLGIAQSDKEMDEYRAIHDQDKLGNSTWGGGDFMYANLDDDPAISKGAETVDSHGDLSVIGNSTPRFSYGFRGSVTYKSFDLSCFFQGVGKRDIFIDSSTFFGITAPYQRTIYEEHMDYFRYADHPLGANKDAYYARIRTDRNNTQCNDRYLQDASYLRLKNVTIGYTLPQISRLKGLIKKLRIYASGENLLTFTNLLIFDPEAFGSDAQAYGGGKTYPMYRTFSIGLNVMF